MSTKTLIIGAAAVVAWWLWKHRFQVTPQGVYIPPTAPIPLPPVTVANAQQTAAQAAANQVTRAVQAAAGAVVSVANLAKK